MPSLEAVPNNGHADGSVRWETYSPDGKKARAMIKPALRNDQGSTKSILVAARRSGHRPHRQEERRSRSQTGLSLRYANVTNVTRHRVKRSLPAPSSFLANRPTGILPHRFVPIRLSSVPFRTGIVTRSGKPRWVRARRYRVEGSPCYRGEADVRHSNLNTRHLKFAA